MLNKNCVSPPTMEDKQYDVVLNQEGQYSLWPKKSQPPSGWSKTGKTGSKTECLEYISDVWTDPLPRSLANEETTNFPSDGEPSSAISVLHSHGTDLDFPRELLIHEVIAAAAQKNPAATAVISEDRTLSYEDVQKLSDMIAEELISRGVRPEVGIGIYMERSPELIVAILGVLKAGGVCVPLDPAYPDHHIDLIIRETRLQIILTQQIFADHVGQKRCAVLALNPDCKFNSSRKSSPTAVHNRLHSENLAFVFFTSGSTGIPKGVMISHRAIHSHTFWRLQVYSLTPEDRHLLRCSIGFAFLLTEVFTPLFSGGAVVVARPGGHQDVAYLIDLIARDKVTVVNFVPSQIRLILEESNVSECACVRHWVTGGEALPRWLQKKFFSRLPGTLTVIYGATEARSCTLWDCSRGNDEVLAPIGTAAPNKQLYVLDENLQPVGENVTGELYVGGEGLARGYVNQPAWTAEKFIPDPFSGKRGKRLYKTGDLAKFLSDGTLEFLGRSDQQVKIRGYRIELSQVEAAIASHPEIRENVVTVRENSSGNKQLVAYVILNRDSNLSIEDLRSWLKTKLPEFMIPSTIRYLKEFPLTSNAKVDYQALTRIVSIPERELVAPRNDTEQQLAHIWKEVLRTDRVGVTDPFLEIGGDSLSATQIISRIRQTFQTEMSFSTFFEKATIAELSKEVQALQRSRNA